MDSNQDPMDTGCPVCGKNFIPAPFHAYKVYGKRVCSWHCQLKGERDGFQAKKGAPPFKAVLVFDLSGDFIREYYSPKAASRDLAIGVESIRKCCRGQTSHAGGFVFRYKTKKEDAVI